MMAKVISIAVVIAIAAAGIYWVNTFGPSCDRYVNGKCQDFSKQYKFGEKLAVRTNYNGAV